MMLGVLPIVRSLNQSDPFRRALLLAMIVLDHERLIYQHAGRDFRLRETIGKVVREIVG